MNYILRFAAAILFLFIVFQAEIFSQDFFENGEIGVTLSGAGRIRVYKDSTGAPRQIDRSSILVGTGPNSVFGYNQDAQNEDSVRMIQNPQFSDFEIYGSANNSYANLPPNVLSKANIYGWLTGGFAVVKFTVISRESVPVDAYLGMEIIPQINGSYGLESVRWLPIPQIISIYRTPEASYVGYKLLSTPLRSLTSIEWYAGYDTVDPDLWGWLTYNGIDSLYDSGGDGAVAFFSQNPVNIPVGDSTIMYVGISVGDSESEIVSNMNLAIAKYNLITDVETNPGPLPKAFDLQQNYPNPFNPVTTIKFSLPQTDQVSLKVYDMLGNEVSELINQTIAAGVHDVTFDASSLSSGTYFYRIISGNYSETKKMTLIK
jgi:hypothetical protein